MNNKNILFIERFLDLFIVFALYKRQLLILKSWLKDLGFPVWSVLIYFNSCGCCGWTDCVRVSLSCYISVCELWLPEKMRHKSRQEK